MLPSATNSRAGLFALDGHFSVATVEVHLGNVDIFREKILDEFFGLVNVQHFILWRSQNDLALDALCNLPNESVTSGKSVHFRGVDGDVATFQIDRVFNPSWDHLGNFVLQFFVRHTHDVHLFFRVASQLNRRGESDVVAGGKGSLEQFGNLVLRDLLVACIWCYDSQIHAVSRRCIALSGCSKGSGGEI